MKKNKTIKTQLKPTGFLRSLFLLFLALKLTNYIDWSWWAIFSPLVMFGFIGLFMCLSETVNEQGEIE